MFHSAAIKLTLWYLAIILSLSIAFSAAFYHLYRQQLLTSNNRQTYFLNHRLPQPNFNSYNDLRQLDVEDSLQQLRGSLAAFNFMVLIAGGAASYGLARRTLQPIEEALESQKRFTGDASHELRTPLAVMQTENEVALRNPRLSRQQAVSQLKSNLEEVAKLKMLSDGLLRLASFDSSTELDSTVDVSEVVAEAVSRWQKPAEVKGVRITTEVSPATVRGDRESLIELVSILLDNAIKYSSSGGEVKITTSRRGRSVLIGVADKGQGIKAGDLPKIFDRFYQADTARSGQHGYGLGLSIALRIAEIHHGAIEVKSTVRKGSTFTVVLPQA
jgi:signal transduction histidine kinase